MYPINSLEDPAQHGGYIPYFYHRGLHLLYPLSAADARQRTDDSRPAVYDFSTIDTRFSAGDQPQTVEQIIQHGYFPIPRADPVTAIITDKKHTSRLGLDDVIGQIRQRYEIYEQNLYQIELSKCAATNAIYRHEAYCGPASASSKQHYAKHKAIQGLYEQERLERVNLWKDVSRLRLLLPENAQSYLAAYRKSSVLKDDGGEFP